MSSRSKKPVTAKSEAAPHEELDDATKLRWNDYGAMCEIIAQEEMKKVPATKRGVPPPKKNGGEA